MKQTLTAKFIDGLKAASEKQVIIDAATPNLRLIVRSTGSKVWAWQGKCKGKPLTLTLGRYPSHGLADARIWAADLNERRDGGEDLRASNDDAKALEVAEPVIDPDAYRTCDWLFDVYMTHEGKLLKSSGQRRSMYDRFVKPVVGSKHVTEAEYEDFLGILRTTLLVAGPVASNRLQSTIRRWWRWSASLGRDITLVKINPVSDLPKLAKEKPRKRALNPYEIGVFFRVMESTPTFLNEGLILILYTGARRNESLQLPWSEINFSTSDWLLPEDRNKSERDHLQSLPSEMIEMLKERRKITGNSRFVWPAEKSSADEPKPIRTFGKQMKRINDACQKLAEDEGRSMKPFTIHDLRRSVSTGMSSLRNENDMPRIEPHIVERALNHKMGTLAGTYNTWDYYAEKKAALRMWADHLTEIRTAALSAN